MNVSILDDMRFLENDEINKRGCKECTHVYKHRQVKQYEGGAKHIVVCKYCPYVKCPYTELDDFDTYEDYLKSLKKKGAFYANSRK